MSSSIPITFSGVGPIDGAQPIVILGPNGSGKTRLAQQITQSGDWTAIGAQRRTWLDEQLPLLDENNLNSQINNYQNNWRNNAWQPNDEINILFSKLVQEHIKRLTQNNEAAILSGQNVAPITDTKLIMLQTLWGKIYPYRKLDIDGYFPKVIRTDNQDVTAVIKYQTRNMSDGERSALYLAAKVLTAEHSKILIDEPELHLHSRLAIEFWSALEELRTDCRFVYITHDLNFALSRHDGVILTIQADGALRNVGNEIGELSNQVLGAATLPFHAKRIVFYEGEEGRGFASKFFKSWFKDKDTFAIAAGNRDAVCAAVSGLISVGVTGAEVLGIVDSDYYPDAANQAFRNEIQVLKLHEIESILCIELVVKAIAAHQAKNPEDTWNSFLTRVRTDFSKKPFSNLVATRVRCRVTETLNGAFNSSQIENDLSDTLKLHQTAINSIQIEQKITEMFTEEENRAKAALDTAQTELLLLFPGKHLLNLLYQSLGFNKLDDLTELVLGALTNTKNNSILTNLGNEIEGAIAGYLPPRQITPASTPQSPPPSPAPHG